MSATEPASSRNFWIGVTAVAGTYVYFLLFAEFAFLQLLAPHTPHLRLAMGALGAGGVAGSLGAAWAFRPERFRASLAAAMLACAGAALLALFLRSEATVLAVALGVGVALGWCTVTLSAGLRALLGARLGLGVGVGTGLAYAVSNLPGVFTAAPAHQAVTCAALLAGTAALLPAARPAFSAPAAPATLPRWVVIFLALVWMDSAAFYIIQHNPALQGPTWSGPVHLLANAAVHLAAALGAGWSLDRGALRPVAVGAWLLLALACVALGNPAPSGTTSFAYAAGVSLYSAALVFYPAASGRPWVAAIVFSVAGWIGSALGIGMAQDLEGIPRAFVLVAGLALTAAAFVRHPRAAAGVATLALLAATAPRAAAQDAALEARGREVYIAEGCINCHSQYVRPHVALDVERWGPAVPLEQLAAEQPPLPGNRRQGPDLLNVGLRRSAEWHRLHLRDPRALNPGSRMPAYGHLFADGDPRGEALVAYLASLGRDRAEARLAFTSQWTPRSDAALKPAAAAKLFVQLCSACHGPTGAGDGPLAARLSLRPPNWPAGAPWRHTGGDEVRLARVIKFGLPGTPMPGHESLPDDAVRGLARHVRGLAAAATHSP